VIDEATSSGWSQARVCRALDLADVRVHRWRRRLAETGTLEDRPPIGNAVHRLLDWEEQAILELLETWGPVDRSHRKLAHRGSYLDEVFVSESTVLRVALKHRIRLPGERYRPKPVLPAMPRVPASVQSPLRRVWGAGRRGCGR
jgi:putative transposase